MPSLMERPKQQLLLGHGDNDKARDRIQALANLLHHFDTFTLLQESQNPAKDLLEDENVADLICYKLAESTSGMGNDEVCQWLFDTYQTQDAALQAVVLRFIPTLCGLYLPRAISCPDEPLAGFEAVLLALYATEVKAQNGRPPLVNIPGLSQASLYHTPRNPSHSAGQQQQVGDVLSALEPEVAVKSTKRASIVGVALELFWRRIAVMPSKAKLDLCHYAKVWAVQGCSWVNEVDTIGTHILLPHSRMPIEPEGQQAAPRQGIALSVGKPLAVDEQSLEQSPAASSGIQRKSLEKKMSGDLVSVPDSPTAANYHEVGEFHYPGEQLDGPRVPLDQHILRPIFKVLGHCLMGLTSSPELKAAAAEAAHVLYVRATHALNPEAILASRSLLRLHAAAGPISAPATESPMP